jgi:catechol 2,3-dioxygenase-like lactoylglutathione lyase family enzyme
MAADNSPLGTISMAATTLYVADLDASLEWYAEVLGLTPIMVGSDGHPYATFTLGGALVVLEPIEAAIDPTTPGAENTTINLLVDRPSAEVHADLIARGVACSDIVDSPGYCSFLFSDPDGNRFYAAQPVTR